jgi:hypothetical protein
VAGVSLALALTSWLIAIIKGDVIIRGWVIILIKIVLISVLWCYSLIVRWSSKVLLNIINPISFKPEMITCNIRRVDDINQGFRFI